MQSIRNRIALLVFAVCTPLTASHLVTGNGYGFAVVSPEDGAVTKFYAHPYSFARPDPQNALSEGIETANLITSLGWSGDQGKAVVDYVDDSHVIRMRSSRGDLTGLHAFRIRSSSVDCGRGCGESGRCARYAVGSSDTRADIKFDERARRIEFAGVDEKLSADSFGVVAKGYAGRAFVEEHVVGAYFGGTSEDPDKVAEEFSRWRQGLNAKRWRDARFSNSRNGA